MWKCTEPPDRGTAVRSLGRLKPGHFIPYIRVPLHIYLTRNRVDSTRVVPVREYVQQVRNYIYIQMMYQRTKSTPIASNRPHPLEKTPYLRSTQVGPHITLHRAPFVDQPKEVMKVSWQVLVSMYENPPPFPFGPPSQSNSEIWNQIWKIMKMSVKNNFIRFGLRNSTTVIAKIAETGVAHANRREVACKLSAHLNTSSAKFFYASLFCVTGTKSRELCMPNDSTTNVV